MRFRADEIHDVRRGEKTRVHRPYERRPLREKVGRHYVIEKLEDIRTTFVVDDAELVRYETVRTTLEDEYIEIIDVSRRPLEAVTDDDALAEGFESREDWLDVFSTEYGDHAEVWAIDFRYAVDLPNLLARGGGYTHTDFDAVPHEPEAVDRATADEFARRSREGFAKTRRRDVEAQLRECPDDLARIAVLREAAQGAGVDVRSELRVLERRLLKKIQDRERRAA